MYDKTKHDIGILRQDGSSIGLMLVQKDGVPQYEVIDDDFLAEQQFTGVPGYGALPPEKELAIRQDDWRAGFGLEVYDALDPKRYFSAIDMDLRFKGMAICGPKASTVTTPDVAGSSSSTQRPNAAGDLNQNSQYYSGGVHVGSATNYEQVDEETADDNTTYIINNYQNTWRTDLYNFPNPGESGAIANIRVYYRIKRVDDDDPDVTDDAVARVCIKTHGTIYYGLSKQPPTSWTTYSQIWTTNPYTGAAWAWTDINALQIGMYMWGDYVTGGYTSQPYCTQIYIVISYAATSFPPTLFAEFNGNLYCSRGTKLCKLNANATEFTLLHTMGTSITALEPFADDKLYIAVGGGSDYSWMNTAEDSPTAVTSAKAEFFKSVNAASPTLWKAIKPREIKSATDPTANANWSAATNVDNSSNNITALLCEANSLYVMKEDRPFYLDEDKNVKVLIEDTKAIGSETSGKNSIPWLGKLYMPWGEQGLIEYDSGTITWRSPSGFCTNLTEFTGRVLALASDEEWLFAILEGDQVLEVLAGRLETIDNITKWVWHPIAELDLAGCETTFVSSVIKKRLYISSSVPTDDVYYIPLPTGYGNITNDPNRDFQTDGYFITPWLHADFKGDDKAFTKLILTLGHDYDADIYLEAHYQKLGDSVWTDIGDFKGTSTNRVATQYILEDANSNDPASTMIRFKFVAKTDDATKTPILLSYDCRAMLTPSKRRIIRTTVKCADNLLLKDGSAESTPASVIKAALEEADGATWPVTFYDIDGDTKYVKFLPMRSAVTKAYKNKTLERHFYLLLQGVTLE